MVRGRTEFKNIIVPAYVRQYTRHEKLKGAEMLKAINKIKKFGFSREKVLEPELDDLTLAVTYEVLQ